MAGEVQRELDSTRVELRRGVFELPRETSEAADAMRRVVSDQIKALRDLAAVVSASGVEFDVSEPAPPTAPARSEPLPPPAPRREAPPRQSLPPAEDLRVIAEPEPVEAPRLRTLPVQDEPRYTSESSQVEPVRRARPLAPISAPTAPAATPAPAAAPSLERNQAGWLSNLLAAASREEPQPAPRSNDATLESISTDIAGLVDTAAAAEMYERWRSGDTTAVSRRLYTSAGQQTFDDIRRRIRVDAAFRDSVTRYIKEFERLLAKIGQTDRDGAQSRLAMLSDSGKVYILLAHASGRLG